MIVRLIRTTSAGALRPGPLLEGCGSDRLFERAADDAGAGAAGGERLADGGIPGGVSGRSGDFQPLGQEEERRSQEAAEGELLLDYRQALPALKQEVNAFVSLPPEPPIAGRQHQREPTETEKSQRQANPACRIPKGSGE